MVTTARQKHKRPVSSLIRFAATQMTVVGWLAMSLSITAATVPTSYRNQFRGCVGRLLSVDISSEAAATACAAALYPTDLSKCVVEIEEETAIRAAEALTTCRQVRQPNQVANCVIGISRTSQEEAIPGVLDYCRRSLLPERYAECVVGLRIEADFAPTQALETCIDASDPLNDVAPGFVPQNQTPLVEPAPPLPDVPQDLTPLVEPPVPTPPDLTPIPTPTPINP